MRRIQLLIPISLIFMIFITGCTTTHPLKNESQTEQNSTTPVQPISINPYWIRIDPVPDHLSGEAFSISGSTNFPVGEELFAYIGRPIGMVMKIPIEDECAYGKNITVLSGDPANTWIFHVNVSSDCMGYHPDRLLDVTVYSWNYRDIGVNTGVIIKNPNPFPAPESPPPVETITKNPYWIRIDPVPDHYAGESFTITGTTNIPVGETVQCFATLPYPSGKSPIPDCLDASEGNYSLILQGIRNNSWTCTIGSRKDCFENRSGDGQGYPLTVNNANYRISGYSTLVVLNPKGKVETANG